MKLLQHLLHSLLREELWVLVSVGELDPVGEQGDVALGRGLVVGGHVERAEAVVEDTGHDPGERPFDRAAGRVPPASDLDQGLVVEHRQMAIACGGEESREK